MIEEIPSGWKKEQLGKACLKTIQKDPRNNPDAAFMYIDVSSVSNQSFSIVETKSIMGKEAPSRARKLVRKNDVIFATVRPTLKRIAKVPPKHDGQICSTGFCVLRADNNQLDPDFLYFNLLTDKISDKVEGLQKGATYPAISDSDLFGQQIFLPPLPEQRAISCVLRAVQQAREARLREIALERERKAALMEHLFRHGTRGEATKQTDIGEMPESWVLAAIDELKAPIKGSLVAGPFGSNIGKRFFVENGVPVIRGNNLTKGHKHFIDSGFVFITEEKAKELKSCISIHNDLIFTAAGTLGQIGIIPEKTNYKKYIISNKQIRLRVDESIVCPLYLFYWISTPTVQYLIKKENSGTSIPVLNLGVVKRLPVPIPTVDEQKEVIIIIQACDAKIAALEHEARLHDELFRAMLEELMTGRLRAGALAETARLEAKTIQT